MLSQKAVRNADGRIAREGDDPRHDYDPAEPERCHRIAAGAAEHFARLPVRSPELADLEPFCLPVNRGDTAPAALTPEYVRAAFRGTLHPWAEVRIRPALAYGLESFGGSETAVHLYGVVKVQAHRALWAEAAAWFGTHPDLTGAVWFVAVDGEGFFACQAIRLTDMVLADPTRAALDRVLAEYRQQDRLRSHGLSARRKLLLVGPPGSGKTMTAAALAGELKHPLLVVRFDAVITKFMGETAAKLRQVFDAMATTKGVYLFDEFDAIGSDQTRPNDVGEIRRVLNSFLQFLEADDSDSLIVAATNHRGLLDAALFRRFDDVVRYGEPVAAHVEALLKNRLSAFDLQRVAWDRVVKRAGGLSYAEIARSAGEAAKAAILSDRTAVTTNDLMTGGATRSVPPPGSNPAKTPGQPSS